MAEKVRVAMISVHGCPLLRPGGREAGGMNVYLRAVSRELGRRGIPVDVFTRCHEAEAPSMVDLGGGSRLIHVVAGRQGPVEKERLYAYLPQFRDGVLEFQRREGVHYHIVHSHYWLSGWVGQAVSAAWSVPHVVTFHTLGESKNRSRWGERESSLRIETERRVVAQADKVVACSPEERQQLLNLYWAGSQKVAVIPCGVDLGLFRPMGRDRARRQLGLKASKLLLYVGRLEPLKGVDILLRVVSQLSEEEGLHLMVVGGDAASAGETERLRRIAWELGVQNQVSFLGTVDHEALPLYYSAADICVVPSYYESFGMVAVEALACGTPVVAARVGGLRSTIRDGEMGYLIPWHCPEPYAERLELLLGNESLKRSFGRAGRAWVERFSWSLIAEQVLALYEELLDSNTVVPPSMALPA
ncbi:MAG: glycosyltransferase [Chloroflexi bacterium]|nr:glycosyltransferase [Chloroflexota bacterium]